ncbi:hypothetical protein B0A54_01399 [Friedmanniomyces endolithicus]|uniref:Uncharacterized protein n=1 Tax=Friedmanniomyces endolithicus TaxID=329885 RepID=A0A4U0VFK9_9PEZI|nr:hypothetical protein B0A54_01399 [Friedmanniomyces endolithicus]
MQKRNSEAARFLALFYALPKRTPETTTLASTDKSASPEIQPDGPQNDARLPSGELQAVVKVDGTGFLGDTKQSPA